MSSLLLFQQNVHYFSQCEEVRREEAQNIYNSYLLFIIAFASKKSYNKVLALAVTVILTYMIVFAAPYAGSWYLFSVVCSMPCYCTLYCGIPRKKST